MGFTLFVLVWHQSLTSMDDMTLLLTLVANGILPAAVGRLVLDTNTVPTPLPSLALRVALLVTTSVTVALLITTSVTLPLPRLLLVHLVHHTTRHKLRCLLLGHFHLSRLTGKFEGQVGGVKQTVLDLLMVQTTHKTVTQGSRSVEVHPKIAVNGQLLQCHCKVR